MNIKQIAEAISSHKFETAYQYFSEVVMWNMIGGQVVRGKKEVIKTCDESAKYLSNVKITFGKFKTLVAENSVIIESKAEYIDDKNDKSVVASCDIYKFQEDKLHEITSYNIEIPQST